MKISLTMTLKNRKLLTPGTIPPDRQAIRTPPPPPHTHLFGAGYAPGHIDCIHPVYW
jgi:hypothetical protein